MNAYRDNGDQPVDADGAPYIWLRYSTQFTTGGRTHTIEMGIPVPLGASAEQREQLIREAEAGMEQLSRRVEGRVAQMLQRNSRPPEVRPQEPARNTGYTQTGTRPTSPAMPAAPPRQTQTPQSQQQPQQTQQAASQTPAREAPQAIPLQEKRPAVQSTQATQTAPPTRTSIGAEMPVTPNLSGSGNIKLGEFIQIIRNNWGLTPKEAMDLLQLGNLSNMNYRDLLRQLEPLVAQRAGNAPAQKSPTSQPRPVTASPPSPSSQAQRTPSPATTQRDARPAAPEEPLKASAAAKPAQPAQQVASTNRAQPSPLGSPGAPGMSATRGTPALSTSPTSSSPPVHSSLPGPSNIPVYPVRGSSVREAPRVYKFDEEDEDDKDDKDMDRESESDENESQNGMSDALARIKIDELKEIRSSSSVVSQGRLTVLHNLLDSQISDMQFQQLIQGIWNTTSDKKLKQDQVEALISWAKEDYFVDDVEVVLAVLGEH